MMRFKLRKRIFLMKVSTLHRRRFSGKVMLAVWCVLFVAGFYLLDSKIFPVLKYLSETEARQAVTRAVNEAISDQIAPNVKYENIIHVSFDKDGKVALMQPDTVAINKLSNAATLAVQAKIDHLPPQTIRLSPGQMIGLKVLTGVGPSLPVKLRSIGIVESVIHDSFDVAGINQIRHRIKIDISAVIRIVIPLVYQQIKVDTSVLLTEAVVMGQVPNIYVNGGSLIIPGDPRK